MISRGVNEGKNKNNLESKQFVVAGINLRDSCLQKSTGEQTERTRISEEGEEMNVDHFV